MCNCYHDQRSAVFERSVCMATICPFLSFASTARLATYVAAGHTRNDGIPGSCDEIASSQLACTMRCTISGALVHCVARRCITRLVQCAVLCAVQEEVPSPFCIVNLSRSDSAPPIDCRPSTAAAPSITHSTAASPPARAVAPTVAESTMSRSPHTCRRAAASSSKLYSLIYSLHLSPYSFIYSPSLSFSYSLHPPLPSFTRAEVFLLTVFSLIHCFFQDAGAPNNLWTERARERENLWAERALGNQSLCRDCAVSARQFSIHIEGLNRRSHIGSNWKPQNLSLERSQSTNSFFSFLEGSRVKLQWRTICSRRSICSRWAPTASRAL